MLSSTLDAPSRTTPSTGMLSPARTTKRSPVTSWSSGISTVVPSRSHARRLRLQADQAFERRGRAGLRARFEQLAEQHQRDHGRARLEVDVVLVQAEQRSTTALKAHAIVVPSATSTSMLAPPPRSACHAPT